jgi:hypothetical protein
MRMHDVLVALEFADETALISEDSPSWNEMSMTLVEFNHFVIEEAEAIKRLSAVIADNGHHIDSLITEAKEYYAKQNE